MARGADGEQNVAWLAQTVNLLGENHARIGIVRDRGGQRDVRDQGDCGQCALQTAGDHLSDFAG